MRLRNTRVLPLFLAALTFCMTAFLASAAESATAATMQLAKTEGTVTVTNSSGRSLTNRDNMRLYNGYHVETKAKSYAWISLDSSKLTKVDAVSKVELRKSGKKLELLLSSGNLFFNVTSPLAKDETLNVRTSTMVVGIRGTSGWIKMTDQWSTEIAVLEGTVQCSVTDPVTGQVKTAEVQSGEKAVAMVYPQDWQGDKCEIIQAKVEASDIDGFVLTELAQDPGLCAEIFEASGLDVTAVAEHAQERLEQDQQEMQVQMDRIESQQSVQENHVSTETVWEPETTRPEPEPDKSDSGTDSGSTGDTGNSDSTGDSGDTSGGTDDPVVSQRTETVPISDTAAEEIKNYLDDSNVKEVIVVLGEDTENNLLTLSGDITVSSGQTLTLDTGIRAEMLSGSSLTVEGEMTGTTSGQTTLTCRGVVYNSGTINVTSIANYGTFTNTGNITTGTTGSFGVGLWGSTSECTLTNSGTIVARISILEYGTLNMNAGTISCNGWYPISNSGTVNMVGGTISGSEYSYVVYNGNNNGVGTFNMSGGKITGGTSYTFYNGTGTFNLSGSGTVGDGSNSAVYNYSYATNNGYGHIEMTGGTIKGQVLMNSGSNFEMTSGIIDGGNSVAISVGGGTFTISGSTTEVVSAGAVTVDYTAGGSLILNGGTITNNHNDLGYALAMTADTYNDFNFATTTQIRAKTGAIIGIGPNINNLNAQSAGDKYFEDQDIDDYYYLKPKTQS